MLPQAQSAKIQNDLHPCAKLGLNTELKLGCPLMEKVQEVPVSLSITLSVCLCSLVSHFLTRETMSTKLSLNVSLDRTLTLSCGR